MERRGTTDARSLSDLTRDAMKAFLSGNHREETLASCIEEFSTQIKKIDQRMERIERLAAEFMKSQGPEVSGSSL